MEQIKKYFDDYLIERCKVDEEFANNRDESKNNIETILFISYALKTIQLTVVILNISQILGMFWIILCQAVEDFYYNTDFRHMDQAEAEEKYGDQFIIYF